VNPGASLGAAGEKRDYSSGIEPKILYPTARSVIAKQNELFKMIILKCILRIPATADMNKRFQEQDAKFTYSPCVKLYN
jgi:hypothetical protein